VLKSSNFVFGYHTDLKKRPQVNDIRITSVKISKINLCNSKPEIVLWSWGNTCWDNCPSNYQ